MITDTTSTGFTASVAIATANLLPALFFAESEGYENGYEAIYRITSRDLGGFPGVHRRLAEIPFDILGVASEFDSELLDHSGVWIEIWSDFANWLVDFVLQNRSFPGHAETLPAIRSLIQELIR